ncbi:c-type cytochrome [Caballeronia insecticola]|uniref:Cytochrome c class I n=1 Tax=Caballeronia insecticola TaxID=758793 RepID=R4WS44_9BURK|nr:cytochrome c [Caballeronia insecticola]BAN27414.1 cytochrome c class I [Caballeronia insecticola]
MLKAHVAVLSALLGVASIPGHAAGGAYGIGTPIDPKAISAWNIDIDSSGHGLPEGSGDVAHGKQIFGAKCASCHGANGEGGIGDALVGGTGTLADAKPKKTIGGYWPYSTTLFDYIRRAMPYNAPQSLKPDEVYALSAYLLYLNHIVPEDTRLDAQSLPKVKMPNREGFVSDPRPGKL